MEEHGSACIRRVFCCTAPVDQVFYSACCMIVAMAPFARITTRQDNLQQFEAASKAKYNFLELVDQQFVCTAKLRCIDGH